MENYYNQGQMEMIPTDRFPSMARLAAGIAHQINNPLDGIKNCLRVIERGAESEMQRSTYFRLVYEALDRIELVVQGLLEYTQKSDLQKELIDLNCIVDRSFALLEGKFKSTKIIAESDSQVCPAFVLADSVYLQRAFTNMFLNAIDAMPSGGVLRVLIKRLTTNDGHCMQVEISDTGCGIAETDLHHIFDPFYTSKDVGKSVGLGLSISMGIIEQHGGMIEVESKEGKGTTFRILLPSAIEQNLK